MEKMQTEKLELFAIVELLGHQTMAGKITEQTIAGVSFLKIDVPETKYQPAFTRLVNPSSVYAINPITEDIMNEMAARYRKAPILSWDAHSMVTKMVSNNEVKDYEIGEED
jgi:hypothetical protein